MSGLFVREYESGGDLIGTTPLDGRLAMAGLVAPAGAFGGRPGVLAGGVVSGTSSTSPMRYSVAPIHAALSRSVGDGVIVVGVAEVTLVETSGAPGSGSRTDVIWMRHLDVDAGDATNAPLIGVAVGSVGGGVPAIPAGAIELGRATVSAGVTQTSAATISHANTQRTAMRGAPIPVESQAQRDALSALASMSTPIEVEWLGTGRRQRNVGSGWADVVGTAPVAWTPSLLASTTAPSLGAGNTRVGYWSRDATGWVHGWGTITFGSSGVSEGSGAYQVSLPHPNADTSAMCGTAYLTDSTALSSGGRRLAALVGLTSTSASLIEHGASSSVQHNSPWTWAAGDIIRYQFSYRGA